LYEELGVVRPLPGIQSQRLLDGVIDLGGTTRIAARGERPSLDGADLVVIQTKATRLNPWLFGQALLSAELVRFRWKPGSVRSVLLCVADDPDLDPVLRQFPDVERIVVPGPVRSMTLPRRAQDIDSLTSSLAGLVLRDARLTRRLRIEALGLNSPTAHGAGDLSDLTGIAATTVHSYAGSLGMWIAGEVICAQSILRMRGATSVQSLVACKRGDATIERALRLYAADVAVHSVG
jgi:hypothetical protein